MTGKIIAHIVGLPNNLKKKFLNDLHSLQSNNKLHLDNFIIVDLDDLTNIILQDSHILQLYNKLDEPLLKSSKDIEKKINTLWKSKFQSLLDKHLSKNTNVILLGLSTFYKNNKINVKILTPIKLFVDIDIPSNAKSIIKDNLINYKHDIINGSFDLRYLDLHFLIKKREDLLSIYHKMNYQLTPYNTIYKLIQFGLQNVMPNGIYFIYHELLSKSSISKLNPIIGYNSDWLAIISILNNDIIKGYDNNKPFIIEKKPHVFDRLKEPLYLYYTSDVSSFMPVMTKSTNIYKFVSTKKINKFTSLLINNPISKLKQLHINLISFTK